MIFHLFNERAEAIRLLDAHGEDVIMSLVDEIGVAAHKGHERRAYRLDRILEAVEDEIDLRNKARLRAL